MTDEEKRLAEFLEDCVTNEDEPGAIQIDSRTERERKARIYRGQAEHHREAASDHIKGNATLQAIPMGYYAMFHKANQAIALGGYDPKVHWCTLRGLRGLFNAPELATDLQRAMDERENVDYRIDPENPMLVEFEDPKPFIEDIVDPFLEEVDEIIDDEFGDG